MVELSDFDSNEWPFPGNRVALVSRLQPVERNPNRLKARHQRTLVYRLQPAKRNPDRLKSIHQRRQPDSSLISMEPVLARGICCGLSTIWIARP